MGLKITFNRVSLFCNGLFHFSEVLKNKLFPLTSQIWAAFQIKSCLHIWTYVVAKSTWSMAKCPKERFKYRHFLFLQVQGESKALTKGEKPKYRGVFGTIIPIVRNEGPKNLYNGLLAGLHRQMCFSSIRIGLYDTMKQLYANGSESMFLLTNATCDAFLNGSDIKNWNNNYITNKMWYFKTISGLLSQCGKKTVYIKLIQTVHSLDFVQLVNEKF